jgi:hypothetical protein
VKIGFAYTIAWKQAVKALSAWRKHLRRVRLPPIGFFFYICFAFLNCITEFFSDAHDVVGYRQYGSGIFVGEADAARLKANCLPLIWVMSLVTITAAQGMLWTFCKRFPMMVTIMIVMGYMIVGSQEKEKVLALHICTTQLLDFLWKLALQSCIVTLETR